MKSGANVEERNKIKQMAWNGGTVEGISRILQIYPSCVKSFHTAALKEAKAKGIAIPDAPPVEETEEEMRERIEAEVRAEFAAKAEAEAEAEDDEVEVEDDED